MLDPRTALLAVENLQAWYGESYILHGVNFEVYPGEVVTLLGRNGAGKTTTLKSIMGIVAKRTGSVRFEGRELIGLASNQIARAGIALCPEERGIFATLSVASRHFWRASLCAAFAAHSPFPSFAPCRSFSAWR